jgi:hypothetical protein
MKVARITCITKIISYFVDFPPTVKKKILALERV